MRDLDKDRRNANDGQVEALDAERIADEVAGIDRGTDPFVAAVRATRMPMIVTNPRLPDNPVVFANDAFCRLTGYERSEILGRNCRFLQGPETEPETVKRIHRAVKDAAPIEIDIRNYRKDGSAFWNRLLLAPVYDGYGDLAYFFASQLDVTRDREKVEGLKSRNAALSAELTNRLTLAQERERELELAMAAGGLGAWSVDVASRSLAASEAYKALLGWPSDRPMTYEDRQSLIHPEDRDAVRAQSDATINDGADYDITHRIVTPQGETRWMKARGVLISDADGAPLRIAGVTQDITREVRSQKMRTALVELSDALRSGRPRRHLLRSGPGSGPHPGGQPRRLRPGRSTGRDDHHRPRLERAWNKDAGRRAALPRLRLLHRGAEARRDRRNRRRAAGPPHVPDGPGAGGYQRARLRQHALDRTGRSGGPALSEPRHDPCMA